MNNRTEQAAHWFARLLDLPADHPELQFFAQWLAADPRNVQEYQAFGEMWGDFSSTAQTQKLAGAMKTMGRRRFVRNGVLGSLLLCGLGAWLSTRQWGRSEQQLFTAIGERRRVALDDGSAITLDADSAVHVVYTEHARQLYLLRGRAIFDVRPAAQRPFIVEAGLAQVRVLGTQFVVERFDQRVRVSVAHGRVAFSSGTQLVQLERDQVAQLDAQGQLRRIARPASGAFSFASGSLSFERADLEEIAAVLSRYRSKPLQAVQVPGRALTAVVQVADIERFVQTLPQLANVRLQEYPERSVLTPR